MNKTISNIFLTTLLVLSPLSTAFANTFPYGKGAVVVGILYLLAQLLETAVTMLFLKRHRLRIIRLGAAYLAVDIILHKLLFTLILPAFGGLVVFAELFLIVLKTAVLFMLINFSWFRNEESRDVSILLTLFAVTVAKVVSFTFHTFALLPAAFKILRFIRH